MRQTDGYEVDEIRLDAPLTEDQLVSARVFLMMAIRRFNELRSAPVRDAHHMVALHDAEQAVERLQTIITQHERFPIH